MSRIRPAIGSPERPAVPPRDPRPVLARPEHGCSVAEALALSMERYGGPGGALEQLAELERHTGPS